MKIRLCLRHPHRQHFQQVLHLLQLIRHRQLLLCLHFHYRLQNHNQFRLCQIVLLRRQLCLELCRRHLSRLQVLHLLGNRHHRRLYQQLASQKWYRCHLPMVLPMALHHLDQWLLFDLH
jgi:hypothetical protein